jgi:hypothetical protein
MRKCFGTIYPDLSRVEANKNLGGKVFRMRITSQGMMHQAPQFEADLAAWEDCQRCEFYRSCFDFSTGKLALRQAASRY